MPVVGLTGLIGAGKSTVARMFGRRGAAVIDADALAHAVLDEPEVRSALAARFGAAILAADGAVRRPELAQRVFGPDAAHAAALADLEAVVHPRVRARIESALAAALAGGTGGDEPVVVLDVPLLAGSGFGGRCDLVVVVECADEVRRERLAARGLPAGELAHREAAWRRSSLAAGPDAWAEARTRVVDTSAGLPYTEAQVDRLWGELRAPPTGVRAPR